MPYMIVYASQRGSLETIRIDRTFRRKGRGWQGIDYDTRHHRISGEPESMNFDDHCVNIQPRDRILDQDSH